MLDLNVSIIQRFHCIIDVVLLIDRCPFQTYENTSCPF